MLQMNWDIYVLSDNFEKQYPTLGYTVTLTFKLNISSQSYQRAHMPAGTEFQNIKNPSKSAHLQCFQLEYPKLISKYPHFNF